LEAEDGKKYFFDVVDAETLMRLIRIVLSPTAGSLKRWLAKVKYKRLDETAGTELGKQRTQEIYEAKNCSDKWIEKRVRGIALRDELINEWKRCGVKEEKKYAILTAEMGDAPFGLTPSEHKSHKGLTKPQENLRDHMSDLELFLATGDIPATTEIARNKDARGSLENKAAAKEGGNVAGRARTDLKKRSVRKVVANQNVKSLTQKQNCKIDREGKV
jgi:hypothetical protein